MDITSCTHQSMRSIRLNNFGILKRFNDTYYKLIALRSYRPKGWEAAEDIYHNSDKGKKGSRGSAVKRPDSISRTKSRVYELATCNPFEYFVTLTVDAEKNDRYNLDVFYKSFAKWLNNLNFTNELSVKYLFVPEQHKNGAWHVHGLMMGLPKEYITPFTLQDKIPHRMKKLIKTGHSLFNWPGYAQKFGFVSMEPVRNSKACAAYVSKYITKQANATEIGVNDHMYYCSKGLKRAVVVYQDALKRDFVPDYTPTNDFVKVKTFENLEDAIRLFCDENEISEETSENDIKWKDAEKECLSRIPFSTYEEILAREEELSKLREKALEGVELSDGWRLIMNDYEHDCPF